MANICYIAHHGIQGQKWGVRGGPPYPLEAGKHTAAEKKAMSLNTKSLNTTSSSGGGGGGAPDEEMNEEEFLEYMRSISGMKPEAYKELYALYKDGKTNTSEYKELLADLSEGDSDIAWKLTKAMFNYNTQELKRDSKNKKEETNRKIEDANKKIEDANKKIEEMDKKISSEFSKNTSKNTSIKKKYNKTELQEKKLADADTSPYYSNSESHFIYKTGSTSNKDLKVSESTYNRKLNDLNKNISSEYGKKRSTTSNIRINKINMSADSDTSIKGKNYVNTITHEYDDYFVDVIESKSTNSSKSKSLATGTRFNSIHTVTNNSITIRKKNIINKAQDYVEDLWKKITK